MLAVAVSLFSLGWNVYRDVILKPRFRVRFITHRGWLAAGGLETGKFPTFDLTVANLGPGTVVLETIVIETRARRFELFDGPETLEGITVYAIGNSRELKAGQRYTIEVISNDGCLLDAKPLRIGTRDAFGHIIGLLGKISEERRSFYKKSDGDRSRKMRPK